MKEKMNLSKVRKEQPESWKIFQFWKNRKTISANRGVVVRDLYTFFDNVKIWVEVVPSYDFAENCIDQNKWYYTINNGIELEKQDFDNITYIDRPTCEEAAFLRAFYLMEIYIKQKKIQV